MIINIANFNFDGGSGGGGKPALLQEKTATIVQNGSQTIVPDEGFDGMSSVQINAAITGATSAIDFSPIGYDAEFSAELNAKFNNDVAYSKTLYDAWNPSNTSAYNLYNGNTKLVYVPAIDTSNVINMSAMFSGCTSLTSVPELNTSNVTSMNQMFSGCTSLTSVHWFDTSKVINMSAMFKNCTSLTSVPEFDTSKVTNMASMFKGTAIEYLDLSNYVFNQEGVVFGSMFESTSGNTLNVGNMYLIGATNDTATIGNIFRYSKYHNIILDNVDTSGVINFGYFFDGCTNIKTLNLSSFDTSNSTTMARMFQGCTNLTSLDFSSFDTSKMDGSNAIYYTFSNCNSLHTINNLSLKGFSSIVKYGFFGSSSNKSLRKGLFKDIGTNTNMTAFDMSYATNWGVNSDEILDARQSLIDSLITYSFDRATAGYPTCTITLSSNTKALLTSEEIAQIEAKGFVIA